MSDSKIPIISLFSGIGGLDLGFVQQNFQVLLALDQNSTAVGTYNLNTTSTIARTADLTEVHGKHIIKLLERKNIKIAPRGLIGGPPCQSFSNGNAYVKNDDIRHTLPIRYASILRSLNAHYGLDFFVFENVEGLASERHLEHFDSFKALFREAGFRIFEGHLDAVNYGTPQKRLRVFIVGFNAEKFGDLEFEFPPRRRGRHKTVASAIKALPVPAFWQEGLDLEDIPRHPNNWAMRPKSPKFRDGSLIPGHNKGKSFRVLSWGKPSYTVAYGHNEVHVHPSGTRRLSVWEALLLQGFPPEFQICGTLTEQFRQVSNAVPPPLADALAGAIRRHIDEANRLRSCDLEQRIVNVHDGSQ